MKSLNQHIKVKSSSLISLVEKLKINKNFKGIDDNTLMQMLMNSKDDKELLNILADIADTAAEEPEIYDDSKGFRMYDYFDEWQDASGWFDRTYKILRKELEYNVVVGWCSDKNFDDVEKKIPKLIYNIIHSDEWDTNMLYSNHSVRTDVWGADMGRRTYKIFKSSMWANDDGQDYIEYWIFLVLDF